MRAGKRTYLYVISAPHGCKIGITTASVAQRKADLERACGFPLAEVSSWIYDDYGEARKIESWVHFALREHRLIGEWFDVTPDEAVDAVRSCRREAPTGLFPGMRAFLDGVGDER